MDGHGADLEALVASVREQVRVTPPVMLDPVVEAITAALRQGGPGMDDAVLGEALMRAATAAARASLGRDVSFQSAQSMALALAATGLRLHDAGADILKTGPVVSDR